MFGVGSFNFYGLPGKQIEKVYTWNSAVSNTFSDQFHSTFDKTHQHRSSKITAQDNSWKSLIDSLEIWLKLFHFNQAITDDKSAITASNVITLWYYRT